MLILSIGSNLSSSFGDRFENLNLAIYYLNKKKIKIIKKSSFFETLSYPNKKNPKFINIVIEATTNLNPPELAATIISIEELLERKRDKKNDPRTCDIDIIDFYGKIIEFKFKELHFIVPHKKMIFRNFVLFPLHEILPNWSHPVTNKGITKLIQDLDDVDKNSILKVEKP